MSMVKDVDTLVKVVDAALAELSKGLERDLKAFVVHEIRRVIADEFGTGLRQTIRAMIQDRVSVDVRVSLKEPE